MTWFILKTEPEEFSFADLQREKSAAWTGVANPGARANMRLAKPGDRAFIYHTGDEKAIDGLAKITSKPYEDPKQPGLTDDGKPKAAVFDISPVKGATTPLPLAAIKSDARFKDLAIVRQGRLSVSVVDDDLAAAICKLTGL